MKVYKLTVMIIDHDELGPDALQEELENALFPNDCLTPQVMSTDSADIGEWSDDNPLNNADTMQESFESFFHNTKDLLEDIQTLISCREGSDPFQSVVEKHESLLSIWSRR